jgi:hypothetical protein
MAETNADAEAIARQLEAANDEIIALAETLDEAQWATMVPGEQWPVGVVVHHIARGHGLMVEWLGLARRGEPISVTASDIDADNARHAQEFAAVTPGDAIEELRRGAATLAECLRSLDADELATTTAFGPGGGMELTTRQLASVAPRHPETHATAVRGALDGKGERTDGRD